MKISDLIQDGSFESGDLESWPGKNACIIESPNVRGGFAALLPPSKLASSFISQIVNVVPLESYQVSISLAKDSTGFSEPVQIRLEYLDNELSEIEGLGLDITVQGSELPSGKEGTFKVIEETTEVVPLNGRFARLTIERAAGSASGVIIDQVSFFRASEVRVTEIPKFYVANTGENTVTVFTQGLPQSIDVVNSPQAMLYLNISGEDRVYVAGEKGVSVINVDTDTVTTTIDIPGTPRVATTAYNRNIIASSDNSTLYVANTDSTINVGFVTVIDTATNTVIANIGVSGGNIGPVPLVLTSPTGPNPNLLFVGISNGLDTDGNLVIIDTTTNTVQSSVGIGAEPLNLLITPNEETVIIGYLSPRSTFDVYNIETGVVTSQFYDVTVQGNNRVSCRTYSLGLALDNELFYIGLEIDDSTDTIFGSAFASYSIVTFGLVDCLINNVATSIFSASASKDGRKPFTFAQILSEDGTTECIYFDVIANSRSNSRIQQVLCAGFNLSKVANISAVENSGFLTLSSDKQFILTTLSEANQAQVIEVATFSTILRVAVGNTPVVIVAIPSDRDSNNKDLES